MADPTTETLELASASHDVSAALTALADALGAHSRAETKTAACVRPEGPITPETLAAAVAFVQPEGAIVMDEGLTAGLGYFAAAAAAPRHSYLALTGGAIGQGLPCATGAALAAPDRKVIALQADGSGLYTFQALWTQAREGLDVTNVVLNNRGYQILALELARSGAVRGPFAEAMSEFDPNPDWTQLARGFGLPAVRVADAGALVAELERSLASEGPSLIECCFD